MALPFWLKSPPFDCSVSKNPPCLCFAIMTALESTSPMECETATLDSISLVDAASSTGEDFLMLDTPRSDEAQPAEEPVLGEIDMNVTKEDLDARAPRHHVQDGLTTRRLTHRGRGDLLHPWAKCSVTPPLVLMGSWREPS